MRITSYGAAEGVTGSKHLAEINGRRILLDCGQFQGHREESAMRNKHLPFDVSQLNAVVLSHAHIDHSGTLPMLARYNYRGRIYATPATRDLCAVMLLDSAHIQERDARWLSKRHQTFVPPTYTDEDVRAVMQCFVSVPYDMPMEIASGVQLTFKDAGHVLGSAMCVLDYEEDGRPRRFIYSGDIGRKDMPILRDPWEPDDADVVMMEGTYGDRDHSAFETLEHDLAEIVNRTAERAGKLIVPTFALERAQEFIYALKMLEINGAIPPIPVYVDSPLTVNITEIFRLHTDLFDDAIRRTIEEAGDPFQLRNLTYVRSQEESMALNAMPGPAIIVAASGMCEYGRVVHHLRNTIEDAKNTVLIIGFQAKNTLGRRIVERHPEVRIFGMKLPLRAEVRVLNALSAHAGRKDLIEFGARFAGRAERLLLVHGEEDALTALKSGLEGAAGNLHVSIQAEGVAAEV